MLRTRVLNLSSTAQEITFDDEINTPNSISVQNNHASAPAYIGGPSVTSSDYGIKLLAGDTWSADLGANDKLYAVGTETIAVLVLDK